MANGSARNFMRNRNDRKQQRRKESEVRTFAWQECTPQEQLVLLDSRLGKGVGAVKQRARLAAKMAAAAKPPKVETKKNGPDPTKKKGAKSGRGLDE